MATLIPSFGSCSGRMTSGERRLAQRLESLLEDDYLLWYDVPIGSKQVHPDFVILHPQRGLMVLEVKDWTLDSIQAMDRATVTLVDGAKQVRNPLAQARDYTLAISNLLQRDPELVYPVGSPHAGKLIFPYGYGVVLTKITRQQVEATDLGALLPEQMVICKDEMTERVEAMAFQERLWNCLLHTFGEPLTAQQIDRIRWHIFPELRVTSRQLSLLADVEPELAPHLHEDSERILRVMDLKQEYLARSLGEGHRIIHGVAGSGKTLILVFRCQFLAPAVTKPILVLCFNVALSAKLRQIFAEKDPEKRVIVRHFHGWCMEQLRKYRLGRLDPTLKGDDYTNALVQRVTEAVETGEIPGAAYGAVMVDEGHDFEPKWLRLIAQQVDPRSNSLLILYDDAQKLYGKVHKQVFSFKSLGIQAQGRTTILRINYRNTAEILTLAYEFGQGIFSQAEDVGPDTPILIHPQTAGRHGRPPELIRLPTLRDEAEYIGHRASQFHDRGIPWQDMAIVYRTHFMAETIQQQLRQMGIPVEWITKDADSRFYQPQDPSIKLVTMHSSKGLEFPIVFLPGVGFLPYHHGTVAEEARLFYVAMTRAIDRLILTYDRPSPFVEQIQAALAVVCPNVPTPDIE